MQSGRCHCQRWTKGSIVQDTGRWVYLQESLLLRQDGQVTPSTGSLMLIAGQWAYVEVNGQQFNHQLTRRMI